MHASSHKGTYVKRSHTSNTPDRPLIVLASCVSMVTARVGASSKVWRNLPDNPEGQHTELQLTAPLCAHTLNLLPVCVCVCVCVCVRARARPCKRGTELRCISTYIWTWLATLGMTEACYHTHTHTAHIRTADTHAEY